ncbi:MAG: phosphoglycerate kinase [Clostridia bacterium]|nr:phosphoglycerate kinase [Clostridia bacterium]
MKLKRIKNKRKWQGLKVILRVDFNIPRIGKKLGEDYRLLASLPSINYLLDKGASIIIISHWGNPDGTDMNFSTKVLAKRLAKLSGHKIRFVPDLIGPKAKKAASALKPGEIIFLENLRFNHGEKKNDSNFAEGLANLADIYVNDAFSVCHREQASVSALSNLLPAFAGLQLEQELKHLDKASKPVKPLVLVMGGAKISTKAPMIENLAGSANKIIIGGALANNFLKYYKYEVGNSFYDEKSNSVIASLLKNKKIANKIVLPIDVIVKNYKGSPCRRLISDLKKTDTILDIGPDTIIIFSALIRKAQTIIWNGPMGKFEEIHYKHGSLALASVIAARSTGRAYGLVGGGETVSALKLTRMESHVDWVSTAGGAMLAYLGKEPMPGLKNLFVK